MTITKVDVQVTVPGPTPTGPQLTQKQNDIKNGIAGKALLANIDTGEDLSYDAVQTAIEALIPGTSYTVTALEMTGVAQCDERSQTLTSAGTFIHVRTVEIASVKPIDVCHHDRDRDRDDCSAMNNKTRNIISRFPDFYTRDEDSIFALFVALFGRVLEGADTALLDVMHAHWVDKANNAGVARLRCRPERRPGQDISRCTWKAWGAHRSSGK